MNFYSVLYRKDPDGGVTPVRYYRDGKVVRRIPREARDFFSVRRGKAECTPSDIERAGKEGLCTVKATRRPIGYLATKEFPRIRKARKHKASADLKWSLWSADRCTWEDHAPGLWRRMRRAFSGETSPLTVHTAPRKEIRFGTVTIRKGGADAEFHSCFDEPMDLVPDFVPEKDRERCAEAISDWFVNGDGFLDEDSPIGGRVSDSVDADSFRSMMEQVDRLEETLLSVTKENSKYLDEFLEGFRKKKRKGKRG